MQCTGSSGTFFADRKRQLWDLTTWMPGQTMSPGHASLEQILSACQDIARLHLAWSRAEAQRMGPVPAVERRLRAWEEWRSFRPPVETAFSSPLRLDLCVDLLQRWMPHVPRWLSSWHDRHLPLQWCHGDPWRGNLLFDKDRLQGLIDFGAVRVDAPIGDLARLLGSLAQDDSALWCAGEDAYASIRPLSFEERELLPALDRSGAVGALFGWLQWWGAVTKRELNAERWAAVSERLGELIARIEKWK